MLLRIPLPPTLGARAFAELSGALARAADDPEARVVALVGTPGVFCRGMDLGELVDGDAARESLRAFAELLAGLRQLGRPTLAVVDGAAVGGGVGLAAACDVVIASTRATFALPEALLGLLPGVVLPVLLERLSRQSARQLALSGASRDAAWALARGLADEVGEPADLERLVRRRARELARVPTRGVVGVRGWLSELEHLGTHAGLAAGAEVTASLADDPATRAAVRAFLNEGAAPWQS
jgi:enoyl-CoA hydratase/carnithine racemase